MGVRSREALWPIVCLSARTLDDVFMILLSCDYPRGEDIPITPFILLLYFRTCHLVSAPNLVPNSRHVFAPGTREPQGFEI